MSYFSKRAPCSSKGFAAAAFGLSRASFENLSAAYPQLKAPESARLHSYLLRTNSQAGQTFQQACFAADPPRRSDETNFHRDETISVVDENGRKQLMRTIGGIGSIMGFDHVCILEPALSRLLQSPLA
jgi:hypothetical protein